MSGAVWFRIFLIDIYKHLLYYTFTGTIYYFERRNNGYNNFGLLRTWHLGFCSDALAGCRCGCTVMLSGGTGPYRDSLQDVKGGNYGY